MIDLFNNRRRNCRGALVGGTVRIGNGAPVAVQSMTNTSTTDVDGSVDQVERIAAAGADLVRLTAQGVREAQALAEIRPRVNVPLVADIHFNPAAALACAEVVDKVRINPGNFVRPGADIEQALIPLLEICERRGVALRIGVNHGSLSPAIMEKYGDTPAGMVESAMQFLRICARRGFHNIVVSIKASNTVVMVQTVRLLVRTMADEGLEYPLHLGVTEAGDGEDGRVKSAVGIGALLYQGIGDTIRVSLSEDPEREVPVARALLDHIAPSADAPEIEVAYAAGFDPIASAPLPSRAIGNVGGGQLPVVVGLDPIDAKTVELQADLQAPLSEVDSDAVIILSSDAPNRVGLIQAMRHRLLRAGIDNPVIPRLSYRADDPDLSLRAAADFGTLLLNGLADGIFIDAPGADTSALGLNILQAARLRISKTEFISCPSCGRTLFDLQSTLQRVKAATSHLPGLKIAIMGCIVNGPGEMADADYGYVGAAAGHISLYHRRRCVEKNIPQEQAIDHLINLIKQNGQWTEPGC